MVADGDSGIRELMADILPTLIEGATVILAENGEEALMYFLSPGRGVDLVVAAVTMEPINGVELIDSIKDVDPTQQVILMSGLPEPKTHRADMFLDKPLNLDTLRAALSKFIGDRH